MNKDIHFDCVTPIIERPILYRNKHSGEVYGIDHGMNRQQVMRFDVRISLPSMIADDEIAIRHIEQQLNRLFRDAMYACAEIASDRLEKTK